MIYSKNRDYFKSVEYYEKELQRCDSCIRRLREKSAEVKDMSRFYSVINHYLENKIEILYVLYEEPVVIEKSVDEYIDNLRKNCQLGKDKLTYNEIVFTLSWVILLEMDVSKVAFILEYMLPEKYVDASLDLIRNRVFGEKCSTDKKFYFKDKGYFGDYTKSEGGLLNVFLSPKENQTEEFIKFLKEIKQKHYNRLIKYYESIEEDRYTYTGSFDYRLTAVAKILNLNKEALAESKFIAADLL